MPYFGQEIFLQAESQGPADDRGVREGAGRQQEGGARSWASTR